MLACSGFDSWIRPVQEARHDHLVHDHFGSLSAGLPGGAACKVRDCAATSTRDVDQADREPSRQDIKAALAAMAASVCRRAEYGWGRADCRLVRDRSPGMRTDFRWAVGSGGGVPEGDAVAEGLELGDEAAGLAVAVTAAGDVVGVELGVALPGGQEPRRSPSSRRR